jgi:hypothetical protein
MRFALSFVFCALVLVACNSQPDKVPQSAPIAAPSSSLDSLSTSNMMLVVSKYYTLKDALVAANLAKTTSGAAALSAAADTFRMLLLSKDSVKAKTVVVFLDTVLQHARAISALADPSCEKQRVEFSPVSNAMYQLLKVAGLKNGGVYREYCPMAFNDKGAYWLSNVSEIKNPYFGKIMLECGEVTDSL